MLQDPCAAVVIGYKSRSSAVNIDNFITGNGGYKCSPILEGYKGPEKANAENGSGAC